MKTKRIIPCLDLVNGRVVKGVNFVNLKDAGDPLEIALRYEKEGADEIVLLDITATYENRSTMLNTLKRLKAIKIPIIVGGGVRNYEDFEKLLENGADKVSISSAAFKNPALIEQVSKKFGKTSVIAAIDAKKGENNMYEVYIKGGRENTHTDAILWAKKMQELGAGELLVTSMDCDGTKNGYDIELTSAISQAVEIGVIASGGAGNLQHFYEVLTDGGASAALAASLFHFKEIEITELKKYLASKNVMVKGI